MIERAEGQIAKLASRVVSETLGLEREAQWNADVEPLGTGSWGVVYPLVDERFVLKVTADPTEGPIISKILSEPQLHDHMAIIHYFALRKMSELHVWRGKQTHLFVTVAERLKNVGELITYYGPEPLLPRRLRDVQTIAHNVVKEKLRKKPRAWMLDQLQQDYLRAVERVPDNPLSDFFIQFYDYTDGGVLADVHLNNLGQRGIDWDALTDGNIPLSPNDRYWVISDPGHSAANDAEHIEEPSGTRDAGFCRNSFPSARILLDFATHGGLANYDNCG